MSAKQTARGDVMPFDSSRYSRKFSKQLREEWEAVNAPCYLCGQPINYAQRGTRDSLEIEHVIPTSKQPELMYDRANLRPAHLSCNRAKSDGAPQPELGELSEQW